MKLFACPTCGAQVRFQSRQSVYAVCEYCSSMIVRSDVDVEAIGTMAALPDDMSPLQIGTEGKYRGEHFGIIGRVKMSWDAGLWNEWCLLMDDGRRGWLAEAQGTFAIAFELELTQLPASFLTGGNKGSFVMMPKLGMYIPIKGIDYRVMDIKKTVCVGSEGELPFPAPKGRESVCVDLLSKNGEFASIELYDGAAKLYAGHYIEWGDMRPTNIRELEGW